MTAVGGFIDAYLILQYGAFGFAQTGNVIFLAVNLAEDRDWIQYVYPILAYLLGLCTAQVFRTVWPAMPRPLLAIAMATQVVAFMILASLPLQAPTAIYVVVLSFTGGVRLELFRSTGGFTFVSIATTGNLMRFVGTIATLSRDRTPANVRLAVLAGGVVAGFFGGAIAGAISAHAFAHAGLWGAVVLEIMALLGFLATRSMRWGGGLTP